MKVEILSRKLVKPSIPTPTHLRNYKLSLFDQLTPPAYVTIIFYYSSNCKNSLHKNAERHVQLEKSLSETLTKFYQLSGRIIKDQLLVDCNDQGVDFLEARVSCELDEFLTTGPKTELLDQLVPWDLGPADSVTSPLLAIQINNFNCGGLVVGLRVSHKIADASSITTFINEWTNLNRTGTNGAVFPIFDSSSLFPPRTLPWFKPPNNEDKVVTRRFVFDGSKILALKDRVRADLGSGIRQPPTRVTAVTALIWKALISVAQAKNSRIRSSLLSQSMNLRGRKTGLFLPENCFGNLFTMFSTKIILNENEAELLDLVGKLGDSIRDCNTNFGTTLQGNDVSLMVIKLVKEMMNNESDYICCFTSWCRFSAYEADFGWGKPSWVSTASLPYPMVALMDTKCGDGIEAWVSLNEEEINEFEKDLDVLAFIS